MEGPGWKDSANVNTFDVLFMLCFQVIQIDVIASSRLETGIIISAFLLEVVTAFVLQNSSQKVQNLMKVLFGRAWTPVAVMHLK